MTKKIIAFLISAIITFTIYAPVGAYAEDQESVTEPVKVTTTTEKKEETTTTTAPPKETTTAPPKETTTAPKTEPTTTTTKPETKATETTTQPTTTEPKKEEPKEVKKVSQKINVEVFKDHNRKSKDNDVKITVEGKLPEKINVSAYPDKEDAFLGYKLIMEDERMTKSPLRFPPMI